MLMSHFFQDIPPINHPYTAPYCLTRLGALGLLRPMPELLSLQVLMSLTVTTSVTIPYEMALPLPRSSPLKERMAGVEGDLAHEARRLLPLYH